MTSQQIIDKLIQIELYRIHAKRNPTNEELTWESSYVFHAKPFKREYGEKLDLDYEKYYIVDFLNCDKGSPKIKLIGDNKFYDHKDFIYKMEAK